MMLEVKPGQPLPEGKKARLSIRHNRRIASRFPIEAVTGDGRKPRDDNGRQRDRVVYLWIGAGASHACVKWVNSPYGILMA